MILVILMLVRIQSKNNNNTNSNTNSIYIFVPDTPVLVSTSTTPTGFSISPHQRMEISTDYLSEEDINRINEYGKNFVNVSNRWWLHRNSIPRYMNEFPDMFNIIKPTSAPEGCEFIADTPLPLKRNQLRLDLDYSLDPHIFVSKSILIMEKKY